MSQANSPPSSSLVDDPIEKENNFIPSELSEEAQLKLEVIQTLLEPCDRATYGQRLQEAAEKLGKSKRTVQRLVQKWEEEGLEAIAPTNRSDKGNFRIEKQLQEFIVKTYQNGNKGSLRVTRKQVYLKTKVKAEELGIDPPSHMTVYRILQPVIEKQEKKKSIRSPGWRGRGYSINLREVTGGNSTIKPKNGGYAFPCGSFA